MVMPAYVCRNPSCASVGKSHPNCKCGPVDMAEGGSVSFCSESRNHAPDCEYYADGGLVPQEDIPQSQSEQTGQPVPPEDQPTDYTTTGQQLKTVAEGVGQGVLGPLAPLDETN